MYFENCPAQALPLFFLYVLRRKKFHSFHYKAIESEVKLERLFEVGKMILMPAVE
ncbi:hypothetical protein KIS4809_5125 [Bacillus sp. ZZV12-4809]|nr:hypothetical protein KIS4809_5125 [Bacillus sp. ZZV12-4809]